MAYPASTKTLQAWVEEVDQKASLLRNIAQAQRGESLASALTMVPSIVTKKTRLCSIRILSKITSNRTRGLICRANTSRYKSWRRISTAVLMISTTLRIGWR